MGADVTTKAAAVHQFMSGFGIPAYAASSVPSDSEMPYLTYRLSVDGFTGTEVSVEADLWYYGESESVPNAKAEEVSRALGLGGRMLPCDNGAIWIKRGSPFCQSVPEDDSMVKRRYINLDLEFITAS